MTDGPLKARPVTVIDQNGIPIVVPGGTGPLRPGAPGSHFSPEEMDIAAEVGADIPFNPNVPVRPEEVAAPAAPLPSVPVIAQNGPSQPPSISRGGGTPQAGSQGLTEAPRQLTPEEEKARNAVPFDYGNPALYEDVSQGMSERTSELGKTSFDVGAQRSAIYEDAAARLQENAQAILEARAEAQEEMARAQEESRARAQALFSQRFDPSRILHSPDSAASFGIHLGVAVGHMIQQFSNQTFPGTNGQNPAMRLVEDAIERDIAQQREMFSRGEAQLRQDSAFMTGLRELHNDRVLALEFARSAAMENVATQLEAIAATYEGTRVSVGLRNEADNVRRQVMDRHLHIQMQVAQLAAQQVRRRGRSRPAAPDAIRPAGVEFVQTDNPDILSRQRAFQNDESLQRRVYGLVTGIDQLTSLLRQMDGLVTRGESGNINFIGEDAKARAESLFGLATLALKNASDAGAIDQGVLNIASQIFGNPGAAVQDIGSTLARLRTAIGNFDQQRSEHFAAFGLTRPRERPRGQIDVPTEALVQNRVVASDEDVANSSIISDQRTDPLSVENAASRAEELTQWLWQQGRDFGN